MIYLMYMATLFAFFGGLYVENTAGTIWFILVIAVLNLTANYIWVKKYRYYDSMGEHVSKMTEVVNDHSKFLKLQRELNNNVVAFMKAVSKTEDDSK